ncbi:hypothetical protein IIA79_02225 [bacterium]|nr:hypothetical protein [bacterium]
MVVQDVGKWARIQKPWRKWDFLGLRQSVGLFVQAAAGGESAGQAELINEIEQRGAWASKRYGERRWLVNSIYFALSGHGKFDLSAVIEIAASLRGSFPLNSNDLEFTIELSPEQVGAETLRSLAGAGVNRLSIPLHACQQQCISWRSAHRRNRDALVMLEQLSTFPIRRLNFDLLYGVPGQTMHELKCLLRAVLNCRPTHVSAYELSYEPGTPLSLWRERFPRQAPDMDTVAMQQRMIERTLGGSGLYRYEVCSYSAPGCESRHNLRYLLGGDFVGLGLGAASRLGSEVWNNPSEIAAYRTLVRKAGSDGDPLAQAANSQEGSGAGQDMAPPADRFLQLRTRRGILLDGLSVPPAWITKGWVRLEEGRLEVTARGLDFADLLARELG